MKTIITCRLETLIDKVNNPNKYLWFVNVPGAFDAAQYLCNNHWDELNAKTKKSIVKILINSGKYEAA